MTWSTIKPSTQAPLDPCEVQSLHAGAFVLVDGQPVVITSTDPVRGVAWDGSAWSQRLGWIEGEVRLPKLPRLSCAATVPQVIGRYKDVTRRIWQSRPSWAEPGKLVLLVDRNRAPRARGLAVVQVKSVRRILLDDITADECAREGFRHLSPGQFRRQFIEINGAEPVRVWRLSWRFHFDGLPWFPGIPAPIGWVECFEGCYGVDHLTIRPLAKIETRSLPVPGSNPLAGGSPPRFTLPKLVKIPRLSEGEAVCWRVHGERPIVYRVGDPVLYDGSIPTKMRRLTPSGALEAVRNG